MIGGVQIVNLITWIYRQRESVSMKGGLENMLKKSLL